MNGKMTAFYEIGVADDGTNYGIKVSMIYETLAVLFYNARKLEEEFTEKGMEILHEVECVRNGQIKGCFSARVKIEAKFDDKENEQELLSIHGNSKQEEVESSEGELGEVFDLFEEE